MAERGMKIYDDSGKEITVSAVALIGGPYADTPLLVTDDCARIEFYVGDDCRAVYVRVGGCRFEFAREES
jgi:hypothetical protein